MTTPDRIDVDWLTALSPSEVDFSGLPVDVLNSLATGIEPNFATLAIVELGHRAEPSAATTAQAVLNAPLADCYLKSAALSVLFDQNRDSAVSFILEHVRTMETCFLNGVMQTIVRDPTFFETQDGARVAKAVATRVATLAGDPSLSAGVVDLFGDLVGKSD